ncbi:MAG TPA: diacylglycerol kinase family lipid kinase [Turneriella sp.]|nr:diacylglycerol kinase family lipid kinase [Turneriella sp.]
MATRKQRKEPAIFIVNPQAGGGKSQRELKKLLDEIASLYGNAKIEFTEEKGHATTLTRTALKNGVDLVVAVGGDGTISEVAAGFFDTKGKALLPLKEAPALGILPAGSGSDYARTLGIPRSSAIALQILQTAQTRTVDAGLLDFVDFQGKKTKRIFINIADIGIGGEVVEILERQGKKLGAFLSYQLATLRGLIAYKNKDLKIILDKKQELSAVYTGAIVALGKYFGSGMQIAPNAEVDDGFFDVVLLGEMTKMELVAKMQKVRKGTHILDKNVAVYRAKHVEISSTARALLDCDGELPGQTPVTFSIIPKAIKVVVPPR